MNDYMTALFDRFCGCPGIDETAEALRCKLSGQLGKEQRRLLLRLTDQQNAYCEQTAMDAFVRGFRLAMEIARELEENRDSL